MCVPPEFFKYRSLRQSQIDFFRAQGVTIEMLIHPREPRLAIGRSDTLGYFIDDDNGEDWIVFAADGDLIYWQPKTGTFATSFRRAFAITEERIVNPATYFAGDGLRLFNNPVEWLKDARRGVVVLDWTKAFDRLRHCSRVVMRESLFRLYEQHMKPAQMPEVFILPDEVPADWKPEKLK
jgi:hypothetical protein